MRAVERVRTFDDLVKRRRWSPAQALHFIRQLHDKGLFHIPPVEGGSANFVQVSGPQGRVQTLTPGASIQTFLWNPQSLKGQEAGGDFRYAKRIKFRTVLLIGAGTEGPANPPTWEQVAMALGNVRVYSPFLGELVPKNLNSVPILANHDMYFDNGFKNITRRRPQIAGPYTGTTPYEFVFEIPFERDWMYRSIDSCPWLPFLEGGIFEVDLTASNGALFQNYGLGIVSATQTCTIDYYVDKQALIHAPVQNRLYRVVTGGPEYVLKSVGSPNGLDGVISGSRLAILSWLSKGITQNGAAGTPGGDNGFYSYFGPGGPLFGTNGLSRLDVPWRDQVSVDDVNAWLESFLSDCNPIRMFTNTGASATLPTSGDYSQWPFVDDAFLSGTTGAIAQTGATPTSTTQSLISDFLDFFPLVWVSPGDKISDLQKVNGDLSFTATQPNPPPGATLNLFRSEEVCGFTPDKVMDLMDRMGLPHVSRGGSYTYVPKYADAKKADPTTVWGFPLKIVDAKAAAA